MEIYKAPEGYGPLGKLPDDVHWPRCVQCGSLLVAAWTRDGHRLTLATDLRCWRLLRDGVGFLAEPASGYPEHPCTKEDTRCPA